MPGLLRSNSPFKRENELLSQLAARLSPQKAEQQPNAPGLLFCFSYFTEAFLPRFSRYKLQQEPDYAQG